MAQVAQDWKVLGSITVRGKISEKSFGCFVSYEKLIMLCPLSVRCAKVPVTVSRNMWLRKMPALTSLQPTLTLLLYNTMYSLVECLVCAPLVQPQSTQQGLSSPAKATTPFQQIQPQDLTSRRKADKKVVSQKWYTFLLTPKWNVCLYQPKFVLLLNEFSLRKKTFVFTHMCQK